MPCVCVITRSDLCQRRLCHCGIAIAAARTRDKAFSARLLSGGDLRGAARDFANRADGKQCFGTRQYIACRLVMQLSLLQRVDCQWQLSLDDLPHAGD